MGNAVLYSMTESDTGMVFTIDEGQFTGISYQYGTVGCVEPNIDDERAVLKFTYAVLNDPNNLSETEDNLLDFRITLGDILHEIITGANYTEEMTYTEEGVASDTSNML